MDNDILGTTTLESMPKNVRPGRSTRILLSILAILLIATVLILLLRTFGGRTSQQVAAPTDDLQATVNIAIPNFSESF